ncbi:pseudouridine synthase [Paenibacillus sp. MSJ-34]|uniref:pseudouridine synthase n=1 Tax=Paenibacillus sp. MSJ-34 TaxID=2841529 RepID=UPI001C1192AD|nr:pseudouridine synthase [Paenibacillus sp. MSJ-34]MBU5442112.1 rRNA pseudouridine synthase [Paenibacillus sp. MSJ-34]
MKAKQRVDKILGNMGYGTRSEIKKWAKLGKISVNGSIVKDSGYQVDPAADLIELDGETVRYRKYIYIMLNKPQGVVSATEDLRDRTVLDLLDEQWRAFEPFPVGRLDKDTVGLLLITNDGKLAHELLSPRKHIPKTYAAEVTGIVDSNDVEAFAAGVELDDGYVTKPAQLKIIRTTNDGEPHSRIELTITEGKFHQVKRMFEAVGKKVVFLRRISMGPLRIDESLQPGEYRELTEAELQLLTQVQGNQK